MSVETSETTEMTEPTGNTQPIKSVVFDRAVPYYDDTRGFPPGVAEPVAALFEQAGGLTRQSRVLEIGIGTGRIALPLVGRIGSITGVDLSRAMMERLREKEAALVAHASDGALAPVYLAEGDITRLPLAAGRFDAAIAVHIFHLVPGWQKAVDEVARALRPGGVLLLGRNNRSSDVPGLTEVVNAAQPSHVTETVGITENEVKEQLRQMGWRELAEPYYQHFTAERTPRMFLRDIEERIWSRLWRLSDDEHATLVKVAHEAAAEKFPDLDQRISIDANFEIRVFQPPQ